MNIPGFSWGESENEDALARAIRRISPFSLPSQTGHAGEFLTTDGTTTSWAAVSGSGDMLKATYDPTNINASAFDYNNFINTPTIPAAQIQSDWNQTSNVALDFIKNKPISTTSCTIDITGLSTLDITVGNADCGIVIVTSSNPTETINKISNCPQGFPVSIYSSDGLIITVQSTSPGSAGQDNICLENNTDIVMTGRTDSALTDFLIIVSSGISNRQIGGSIL